MTRREKLLENYEDALFALLMDEVVEQEGRRLLDENERLRHDPEASISDEDDRRCLKTIKLAFAKKRRCEMWHYAYGIFTHIAVFSLVMMILVGTAYAIFPEIRIKALNLMIEISDVATSLSLSGEDNPSNELGSETGVVSGEKTLCGYCLPEIPDEYEMIDESYFPSSSWIEYRNAFGNTIWISVEAATGLVLNVDTEDAQSVESIQIHSYAGLLIEKGDRVDITWGDTDQNKFIIVACTGIDRTTALSYAESMQFIGEQ